MMERKLRVATVGAGVLVLALVVVTWWRVGEAWCEQFLANLFAGAIIGLLGFVLINWLFELTKAREEREERRAMANLVARFLMEPELVENREKLEVLHQAVVSSDTSGIRVGEVYEFQKTSWRGLVNSGALFHLSIEALGHLRDVYAGLEKIESEAAEVVASAEARKNWPDFVVQNVPDVQTSINFALRALGSSYAKKLTRGR